MTTLLLYFFIVLGYSKNQKFPVESVPSSSMPPPSRSYLITLYIEDKNSIALFGGNLNAELFYNDIWVYDIELKKWEEIVSVNSAIPSN